MLKTFGFGLGAMAVPGLMTGAILYASAPEAEVPVEEATLLNAVETADTVTSDKVYKDYGVVWTKL